MISGGNHLVDLSEKIHIANLTIGRFSPIIATVEVVVGDLGPAVLSGVVLGPVDIDVRDDGILLCQLFEFVVGVTESNS